MAPLFHLVDLLNSKGHLSTSQLETSYCGKKMRQKKLDFKLRRHLAPVTRIRLSDQLVLWLEKVSSLGVLMKGTAK